MDKTREYNTAIMDSYLGIFDVVVGVKDGEGNTIDVFINNDYKDIGYLIGEVLVDCNISGGKEINVIPTTKEEL